MGGRLFAGPFQLAFVPGRVQRRHAGQERYFSRLGDPQFQAARYQLTLGRPFPFVQGFSPLLNFVTPSGAGYDAPTTMPGRFGLVHSLDETTILSGWIG